MERFAKFLAIALIGFALIGCGGGNGTKVDKTPPKITLLGKNPMSLNVGDKYVEAGAKAVDDIDGDVSNKIKISGSVDTSKYGDYSIIYQVEDSAGNMAKATRTVHVLLNVDTIAPVIILKGENPITLYKGDTYLEPGATAFDNRDGNLTSAITISGIVDSNTIGSYTLLYSVSDSEGNEVNTTRLVYVVNNSVSSSSFPSSYYPTSSHPKLWLTSERLASLNRHKTQNSDRWKAFKELCDSIVDNDSSNDPWDIANSPQNYTAPLALMYIISKNSIYADKALELMDKIDDNLDRYGDPDHQSFYFMGLTYDWLYNYAGMTNAKKAKYRDLMKKISDKFYAKDLTASGTDSDFNLLTALHHLVMGIATYDGSDSNAVTMLNRAWQGWSRGYCVDSTPCISNRGIVLAGLGGVYFTGMAYFPSTDIIGISGFEMSMKTACGYDINTQEPDLKPFWGNILRAIIALTEPTKKAIFDYGSWQDPNTLNTQPWMRRALIISEYFATQADDNISANLGCGYNAQVDVGDYNDPFLELFYDTLDCNATDPYSASLPLVTYAKSPDFIIARSSWDSNASWVVFRGDGSLPLDQRAMDMGSFSLWRSGGYLTKGARNYEALSHGDFFNTLSLQNGCSLNGVSCSGTAIFNSQEAATIHRYRSSTTPLMVYGMLKADGQWDDAPTVSNPVDNIKTYRRHFVWIDPYVIVFDRVRANSSIDITWRLRALKEPTISGNKIVQKSSNNLSQLVTYIVEPSNVNITKIDEKNLWSSIQDWVVNASERHWQSQIDFKSTKSINILAAMQMGDTNLSSIAKLDNLSDSNSSSVRVGNYVVSFNKEESLRSSITYTLNSATDLMYHLITDLTPGIYELKINGTKVKDIIVKNSDNTAWFKTNTAGKVTVLLSLTQNLH